jgi:hypothetical protein
MNKAQEDEVNKGIKYLQKLAMICKIINNIGIKT